MDGMSFNPKSWLSLGVLVVLAAAGAGCQTTPSVSVPRLLNYQAIIHTDIPIVQGTVLLAAMFIIVANIVVDVLYAYLDPRVQYT